MKLNDQASEMMRIVEQYKGKYGGEEPPENSETLSLIEFARWSFNQGMRHSNDFLTWIAQNPKSENFTHFIEACASDDSTGEMQWLNNKVKVLNDKKARKWWQKWIKENLQWNINNTQ